MTPVLQRDLHYINQAFSVLDKIKQKYPELVVEEDNANVRKVYKMFGINVGAVRWLRRPRIALLLDDMSGMKDITHPSSSLYRMFTLRRHLGIVFLACCVHSYTSLFSHFRQLLNMIVLHNGIKPEHVKLAYEDIGLLRSP